MCTQLFFWTRQCKHKYSEKCLPTLFGRINLCWLLFLTPSWGYKREFDTYMILALCTAVTVDLLLFLAYWKANSATRREACSVMSLILCTTPSTIWLWTIINGWINVWLKVNPSSANFIQTTDNTIWSKRTSKKPSGKRWKSHVVFLNVLKWCKESKF